MRAVSIHAVRKGIEDNEIMETARKYRQTDENHGRLTNVVRKMRRFRTVGGATLYSKYANLICLLFYVPAETRWR